MDKGHVLYEKVDGDKIVHELFHSIVREVRDEVQYDNIPVNSNKIRSV